MTTATIAILIFVFCYVFFVVFPKWRSVIACMGGVLLVLAGGLHWKTALTETIQWNVVALFFGTLILAELFLQSRMPAVIAEWLVDKMTTLRGAMMAMCVLSGFISMFVENVAVVLLVAPVAISLCEKLNVSPVRLLILIAISSNLQGTATLIGDPPSMILGGYMKMSFNDFFVCQGKPGIFFAVQMGALAFLAVVAWLFRDGRERIQVVAVEKVRSWVPTVLLVCLILILSVTSVFDPDFKWLAGTATMVLALIGLLWFRLLSRWGSLQKLVKGLDWDTTFFLIGVFVIVGGLTESGTLTHVSNWISAHIGQRLWLAFLMITGVSVVCSAFVDNVPFLLAMIPVTQTVATDLEAPVPLLMFALLIGSCLGGNITPIGASANVVVLGILKKRSEIVSFREFMKLGIPCTVAAVIAACTFVWIVWRP